MIDESMIYLEKNINMIVGSKSCIKMIILLLFFRVSLSIRGRRLINCSIRGKR